MPDSSKPTLLIKMIGLFSKLSFSTLRYIATTLVNVLLLFRRKKTLHTVDLNLRIALPQLSPSQLQALAHQAFNNEVQSYIEFLKIWSSRNEENIAQIHQVTGEEYLQQALAAPTGIILIVPHFGTWEIMNAWISQFTAITIMYKPIKNLAIDNFVRQARSRERATLVPTDETGVKQVFKVLKQGGVTAILPDHNPNIESESNTWFGVPLYSSHLISKLLQKTKATPLLLYAMRNPQAGFDMYIEPLPSEMQNPNIDGTQLLHDAMQQLIYRYPQHYHWNYRRFRANPELRDLYILPTDEALAKIHTLQNAQSKYLKS